MYSNHCNQIVPSGPVGCSKKCGDEMPQLIAKFTEDHI